MRTIHGWHSTRSQSYPHIRAFGLQTIHQQFANCSTQRMPSCSKMHVCMLWRAAVPIDASGMVGRIVFICTRQYTSALLVSGPINFVCEIPLAVVANASFKASSPTASFRQHCEAFHATHHSRKSQKVLHYSHTYHSHRPLPLSTVRGSLFQCHRVIRIALRDPELSSAKYVLVRCYCHQHFSFWYVRFPDRRGHPITDTRSRDLHEPRFGSSAAHPPRLRLHRRCIKSPNVCMSSVVVRVQFHQSTLRLSRRQPLSSASISPSGHQVLSVLEDRSSFFFFFWRSCQFVIFL